MAKKRGRRSQFTAEFVEQAVRLARESERSLEAVAKELGIAKGTLWKWCRRLEGPGAKAERVDATESPEEELIRLRKKVRELEMEKEILKKAAAFFAKNQT